MAGVRAMAGPDGAADRTDDVAAIVPARNAAAGLGACLKGLRRAGIAAHRIIVVDDDSSDATSSVVLRHGVRVVHRDTRGGPAAARNDGARAAVDADMLLFVDADVVVAPDVVERVRAALSESGVGAVFGSYDAAPAAPGLVSQYRNLLHHFVHQDAAEDASTFWAGCGAVRRDAFDQVGGFDGARTWHFIEDIELGHRLTAAGWRIAVDKDLQGKHLKQWTILSMLQTDFLHRAWPWSRLILRSSEPVRLDLNLGPVERLSLVVSCLGCALLAAAPVWPAAVLPAIVALATVMPLNRRFFGLLLDVGGARLALAGVPLHVLHQLMAMLGFVAAAIEHPLGLLRFAGRVVKGGLTIPPTGAPRGDAGLVAARVVRDRAR